MGRSNQGGLFLVFLKMTSTIAFPGTIRIDGEEPPVGLWTGASLKSFGDNPYDEPIWRVVWAPSRRFLFGARHADGWLGYRWFPLYTGMDYYILERWLSPGQYMTGEKDGDCTQEMWEARNRDPETGLCQLGPYPNRGVYFGPMWEFQHGYPAYGAVTAAINLIVAGDQYTRAEKYQAILKAQEIEKEAGINRMKEKIMEKMPIHDLNAGVSGSPGRKKAEDMTEALTAADVHRMTNLPIGKGKTFVSGRPIK